MSTFTGVGPALDLDGPLPVAPKHRLLSVPRVLVEESGGRWESGVKVDGYAPHAPSLFEPCSTGTFRVKDEGETGPQPRFNPIAVYYPITCSTHGKANAQVEAFIDMAELLLDVTISFGVEKALSQGVSLSSNPYLADTNLVDLANGATVSPRVGLGYLENAIGLTARAGLIHATPAITSRWFEDPQTDVAVLRTSNGTPVASGGGYIGANPAGPPAGPADHIDWAFATGPVEVRLGALERAVDREVVDRGTNVVTARAERVVLVEWDTALQVGVRIDWSLT